MDRRYFLKTSGIAIASFGFIGFAPRFFREFVSAQASNERSGNKILVAIFMRGAVDGLNVVIPYAEGEYYDKRPTIAVPRPNKEDGAIDLDGYFGLHPSLKSLEKLWKNKQLAIIHSVGSPDNTRSHFDAQDYMESATPEIKSTRDGWLNRILQANKKQNASLFRGVSMTSRIPRSMMGVAPVIAMTSLSDFAIRAGVYTPNVQKGFEELYQKIGQNDVLAETGREAFEAINFLKKINPGQFKPENGAIYPANYLGRSLQQIAQLIKADVGLEIAFTDTPGMHWDTHANQGGSRGQLANSLRIFASALDAFVTDLGNRIENVLILTMSEFGRTVRQNGSGGTDHGHGNFMFVIGGNSVKGGKIYADWRGLKPSELFEGRDLAVTTDFRDVFAEVAHKHLGVKNLACVFPNYPIKPKWLGFLTS